MTKAKVEPRVYHEIVYPVTPEDKLTHVRVYYPDSTVEGTYKCAEVTLIINPAKSKQEHYVEVTPLLKRLYMSLNLPLPSNLGES